MGSASRRIWVQTDEQGLNDDENEEDGWMGEAGVCLTGRTGEVWENGDGEEEGQEPCDLSSTK